MADPTLFDLDADVGSDDDNEQYDEETGQIKRRERSADHGVNGDLEDSSEEDEDDDEEEERKIREGFIVDEEENEETRRRRRKHKRAREEREDEDLDEEDLDLIGELDKSAPSEPKFKRLKRGHRDEARGVNDIFADEDDLDDLDDRRRETGIGEFDDFIEEDEPVEGDEVRDELEVTRRSGRGVGGAISGLQFQGMDEADIEDMRAAFGDGTEYDWALEMQASDEAALDPSKTLELRDVFEPSQLAERMLTSEDARIREMDVPERYQIARKPFTDLDMTEEVRATRANQEMAWVSNMMIRRKRVAPEMVDNFRELVGGVLHLLNVENYEVPFITQNRKDYLIHVEKVPVENPEPDGVQYQVNATKLLDSDDVWDILELDLKWRALAEKQASVARTYASLKKFMGLTDEVIDDMLPLAETTEEVQDLQDYINFQYSAELRDVGTANTESNGVQKRARSNAGTYERFRAASAYNVVNGFGISADAFGQSALDPGRRGFTEDPTDRPDDLADQFTDQEYATGELVLKAAKNMFVEELYRSPKMKKYMRQTYFTTSHIDCIRTDKGLRKIDEDHPYYEFKYLRNQSLADIMRRPERFLLMLKAEKEGMVEVHIRLESESTIRRNLVRIMESDNFSEVADAWNTLRKEVVGSALQKLQKQIVGQVKENLKTECENSLAKQCKIAYRRKIDQAPYKPKGEPLGTEPRVLALTNGGGGANRDAIVWAWMEDGSRLLENGKFSDLRLGVAEKGLPEGADVQSFVELVRRRSPDVIAVSGFSVDARSLYKDLQAIVEQYRLSTAEYTDDEGQNPRSDPLEVVMVNDEVARLYHTSDRSTGEFPALAPLTKYCIGIARYLQGPLFEYVGLGRDILSISLHPNQDLVPQEKLLKQLESATVEIVNVTGVFIDDAITDPRVAALLPFVCGLGPRKASHLLQAINRNGGQVVTRADMAGSDDRPGMGAVIFANAASFLIIRYDDHVPEADFLDSTRIHPEDYELARKVAADGLDMDEEDITAEQEEYGPSGVVRKLIREDKQDVLNTLILEMYADQLERLFFQKKRATLETIRAELQGAFDELRDEIAPIASETLFTMLTGETRETLTEGMVIPVSIKRTFSDHIEVRLDCGVEGTIPEAEYPSGIGGENGTEARQVYSQHQILQARLLSLDRRRLAATLSLREEQIRRGFRRDFDERMPGEWDEAQEEADKRETTKRKEEVTGRAQRVIKHPLFHPFNSTQAEEFLGPQNRGDCVIRPSSKGLDHLAVTWKVADNVFQHIDVLELDKENEFSVGRVLKVGGKYTYGDLDELIVNHVQAMARKVNEITTDDRYQPGSKADTEKWLNAYMEANPKRSMYAFCINREFPGYFLLCFKAAPRAKQSAWPVKVIPNAFQLQKNDYPSMMALKNGFKTLFTSANRGGGRGF